MKTAHKQWTDEELMLLPQDGNKYELVDGELAVSPTGMEHGHVSSAISTALRNYVGANRLGAVLESSTGFRMKSSNILSPDVSFVDKRRIEAFDRLPERFFQGAPDLAVEVLSPTDTLPALEQKVVEYFDNGARVCWLVEPRAKRVRVYYSHPRQSQVLEEQDTLNGSPVLYGFLLPVRQIFERIW
jgi:Uma2 family endonuclease